MRALFLAAAASGVGGAAPWSALGRRNHQPHQVPPVANDKRAIVEWIDLGAHQRGGVR
jgi:hypothetical protein